MPSKLSTCQRIEAGLSPKSRVVQISPSTDLSEMIVRLASSVEIGQPYPHCILWLNNLDRSSFLSVLKTQ